MHGPARASAVATPRQRIAAECTRRGHAAVIAECSRLLTDESPDIVDPGFAAVLAGWPVEPVIDGPHRVDQHYWLRVWAARGLLWAWHREAADHRAVDALRRGFADPEWRVREMCAKVVARHAVAELWDAVAALRDDPVPRVGSAARCAVDMLARRGA